MDELKKSINEAVGLSPELRKLLLQIVEAIPTTTGGGV